LFGIIDNVLSVLATSWIDHSKILNQPKKGEEWRILFPSDPAYMSKEQIAEWEKIKEDIIKDKVTISPGIVGGSLITFSIITPVYSDNLVQNFTILLT
jgi:hypothetical protein